MLAAPLATTPAQAAPPAQMLTECGQDITTVSNEAYLDGDLTCTTGFHILPGTGSDDDPVGRTVNIDLRGHALIGNGTETAISGGPYSHTVNVRDGRIENWASGITLTGSASVTNVQLLNNTSQAMGCAEGSCKATNSVIKNNAVGVWTTDSRTDITNTDVADNGVGVEVEGQFGEGFYSGSTFTRNEIGVRHRGFQIALDARNNVFTSNGIAILKLDEYGAATISGNTFTSNGDGIYLTMLGPDEGSATVSNNIALRNQRYGIYAPGATDGGGNRAFRNGQPCVGVVCATPRSQTRTASGRSSRPTPRWNR